MANKWGDSANSGWLYFWGAPKSLQMVWGERDNHYTTETPFSLQMVIAAMKLKDAYSLEGKL